MFAVATSSIINVLLLRGITKKYLGVTGTIDFKIVLKTLFIAIISNAVAYAFYAFFTNYKGIEISSHIIFILCLILDSFMIYVLAKNLNLPEVYEYMNVYISKLSKMFNYAGRIFVKQAK